MVDWANDRPACVITWVTCLLLGQTRKPFPSVGELKMVHMQFWAGSEAGREVRARALAVQMMHTFRDIFGTRFEKGKSSSTAIPAMVAILTDKDRTLSDLSDTNDTQFLFLEEGS